jgi:hypothetical protein
MTKLINFPIVLLLMSSDFLAYWFVFSDTTCQSFDKSFQTPHVNQFDMFFWQLTSIYKAHILFLSVGSEDGTR